MMKKEASHADFVPVDESWNGSRSKSSSAALQRSEVADNQHGMRRSGAAKISRGKSKPSSRKNIGPKLDKSRGLDDLANISFNPAASELITCWSSFAKSIHCINTYPNGITYSVHSQSNSPEHSGDRISQPSVKFSPQQFHLRFRDTREYLLPDGKYSLFRENFRSALEDRLQALHKSGELSQAAFYFGVTADPFLSLHKKFDVTMACLELLERYRPGFLIVQTRSPMVISGLPLLKMFGDKAVVVMPIETIIERSVTRFTPGQPKIGERLVAANGLRRQGIMVTLSASPILPYGEFYRDAWDFAELLDRYADYVSFGSLSSGTPSEEAQLKNLPLAGRLVAGKSYRWLRPHSYRYLYYAMSQIAPGKLVIPAPELMAPNQLDMFAA